MRSSRVTMETGIEAVSCGGSAGYTVEPANRFHTKGLITVQDVLITLPSAYTQHTTAVVTGCNPRCFVPRSHFSSVLDKHSRLLIS